MLVVDVEGEVSAASMVKDSKLYIEIAKFVQAYNLIIKNPNEFLIEIDEDPIDAEKDNLTWEQFVAIIQKCDLGFDPVPNSTQLAMYYSYAKQIGSISKEVKSLATVSDVAEAQKRYYNFIDDTTAKIENQYNKQHQIAENRAQEVMEIENNISKKKIKTALVLVSMALCVLCVGFGAAGFFFNIAFVRFFGFGNRFVGGVILIILGFVGFFFLDKFYLKTKYDFLKYKKDSEKIIARNERTAKDDLVLKDKLDKFRKDLKIAKYELADKDKSYDVQKCLENLIARNKWYQRLFGKEGGLDKEIFEKLGKENLEKLLLDDMPLKAGFDGLVESILKGNKLGADELENKFLFGNDTLDPNMMQSLKNNKNKIREELEGEEKLSSDGNIFDTRDNNGSSSTNKNQKKRIEQEQTQIQTQAVQDVVEANKADGITGSTSKPTYDNKERPREESETTTYADNNKYDTYDYTGNNSGTNNTSNTSKRNGSGEVDLRANKPLPKSFDEQQNQGQNTRSGSQISESEMADLLKNYDLTPEQLERLAKGKELDGTGMEM